MVETETYFTNQHHCSLTQDQGCSAVQHVLTHTLTGRNLTVPAVAADKMASGAGDLWESWKNKAFARGGHHHGVQCNGKSIAV